MSHTQVLQQTQTVEAAGIPRIEYRPQPEEKTAICIHFTPTYPHDEYAYSEPKFVWGTEVAIAAEWEKVQGTEAASELKFYRIRAIELVEPLVKTNAKERLFDEPYWLYAVGDSRYERGLRWLSEDELLHKRELEVEIEPF
ncbi:hypothetical protein [Gloeothece verrucosa]|uniref:Uncharacterized protein n=1 Tax=Gloeothece verrucosa (strain PCC 7822) TaxID=497965 RepID=E0UEM4_GLOV7|nr:hypothetical protein [Gloeothece verrucosa]ADN16592.1 hypothetical protein Cyan7822_4687 [Gloeothece verrucosa PCC 7822]